MHGYDVHSSQGDRQGLQASCSHLNGASRIALWKLLIKRLYNKSLYSHEKTQKGSYLLKSSIGFPFIYINYFALALCRLTKNQSDIRIFLQSLGKTSNLTQPLWIVLPRNVLKQSKYKERKKSIIYENSWRDGILNVYFWVWNIICSIGDCWKRFNNNYRDFKIQFMSLSEIYNDVPKLMELSTC